jgi:hypothetical protein
MSGAEEEWDEETKARVSAAEAADGQAGVRGRWRPPDIDAMLSEDERKDTAPASAGERCKVTIQQYRLKWSLDVPKNTDMSTVKRTMASTGKLPFKGRLDDAARIIFYTDASLNTRVADDVTIQEDTVVEMRLAGARKRRATAPASAGEEEDNAPLAPAQCKSKAKSKPRAKPDEGEAEVDAEAAQEGERVKRVRAGKAAKMAATAPASAGTDDPPAALWTDTFNRMKEKMRIDNDFELSCAHTLSEFITSELKHFEHTKAPAELVQQNNEDLKLLQGLISSYEKVKGAETAPASAGAEAKRPYNSRLCNESFFNKLKTQELQDDTELQLATNYLKALKQRKYMAKDAESVQSITDARELVHLRIATYKEEAAEHAPQGQLRHHAHLPCRHGQG